MKKYIFAIIITGMIILLPELADAATLSLSPNTGSYSVGQIFSVNILMDTQSKAIDGVDIRYLKYNPAYLEVQDDSATQVGIQIAAGSLMPITQANVVEQSAGRITFSQITSGGTTFTSSGAQILATVHFKVLQAVNTTVSFDFIIGNTSDCNIAEKGVDILTAVTNAGYGPSAPPPPAPYCGDLACNGVETCSSCSSDCGQCDGGGGGGGGGSDTTPPAKPSNFQASAGDKQILLTWNNPSDSDLGGVVIIRKENSAPTSRSDGIKVYEGINHQYLDTSVENDKTYYYAIYAYDQTPNYSGAIIISDTPAVGKIITRPKFPNVVGPFRVGISSSQVTLLQQMLASDPEIYPEGLVTDYYGQLTTKAVQRFQVKYDIVTSGDPITTGYGLAGPNTRKKLNEIYGGGAATITTLTGPFAIGITSNQVTILQQMLAKDSAIYPEGIISGYYGQLTVKAVQRFQTKYNIVTSGDPITTGYGLAGPNTRKKLNEIYGGQ